MRAIGQLSIMVLLGLCLAPSTLANPQTIPPAIVSTTDNSEVLNQQLIGTWRLIKQGNQTVAHTANGQRLKFFTGQHWNITQADPKTQKVIFHHGGTYTFKDGVVVSTVDYANESTAFRIGTVSHFKISIAGDTYTQIGLDNPYTETWQRVKD
jgi:hypothetical protein